MNYKDAVLYTGAALTLTDRAELFTEYARLMLDYPTTDKSSLHRQGAGRLDRRLSPRRRPRPSG